MSPARKLAILLIAAGAVALVGTGISRLQSKPRTTELFDAVPTDAFVAVDVDVDALRASGTLGSLFSAFDPESLKVVCGVDPIERLHELIFAVPEGANADYGVAVHADLTRSAAVTCAGQLATARGDDPSTTDTTRGAFSVYTPKNIPGDGKVEARALAYREGGPILLGHGDWLNRMIDAADDARGGREPSGPHVLLRQALLGDLPGDVHLDVTGTMLLKKSEREELQLGLAGQLPRAESAGLGGLLGVSSASLGLYEKGDEVHALFEVLCDDDAACASVQQVIAKLRVAWTANPIVAALGLGPALDRLVVERSGAQLRVRTSTRTADSVSWLKPFLTPKAGTKSAASASGAAVAPSVPPTAASGAPATSGSTLRVTIPGGASVSSAPLRLTVPGPR